MDRTGLAGPGWRACELCLLGKQLSGGRRDCAGWDSSEELEQVGTPRGETGGALVPSRLAGWV